MKIQKFKKSKKSKKIQKKTMKNVPVCTFKTSRVYRHHAHMCFNMCARGAGTHGYVLNVHTGTC